MRSRTALAAVVLTVSPFLAAAPASAAPGGDLGWGECPDVGRPAAGLQCATLDVPLDYRRPRGRTIEVVVSRLSSTDPARRRGRCC